MWWPALGAIVIGVGGWVEPRALGVGYDVIGDLLHQHIALKIALALLIVKAVMWVIALGSGTSGGVLAPLLMLGAGLGTVLSPVLPGCDPALWPLVCMAATLGATLGAPLTAIVFAFGLTHDANALLPLLAATLVAHGFATIAMKRSIMTEKIARRGYHIYREYGVDPLERHDVAEVMTAADALVAIDGAMTLDAVESQYFGAKQTHRAYPVVHDGRLLGLVDRATLDAHRAQAGSGATFASAFADRAPAVAQAHETCRVVASRLAMLGLERLPVVDDPQSLRLIGIVSRSDLIKPALQHFDDEQKRERFRPIVPVNLRAAANRKAG